MMSWRVGSFGGSAGSAKLIPPAAPASKPTQVGRVTQLKAWGGPKFKAADKTLAPIADKTRAVHSTKRGRGERATAQARHSGASMPAATVRASMGCYTTPEEVAVLVETVEEIAGSR